MGLVRSHLLDLPSLLLSKIGIKLFTLEKVSLKCIVLLLIQLIVVIMSMVILKDFRTVNPDIWITTVAGSQSSIKMFVILTQKQKFFEIGEIVNNLDLRRNCEQAFTKEQKDFKRFFANLQLIYIFIIITGLTALAVKPIVLKERSLPSPWYPVCDIQTSITCYVTCYMILCITGIILVIILLSVDLLFWSMLAYAYLEMECIKYKLLHLRIDKNASGDDANSLSQIASCVKHHNQVLTLIEKINHSYSGMLIYQCLVTLFVVGMSQFCLTATGSTPSLPIMLAYIPPYLAGFIQMFGYCFFGNIIIEQWSIYSSQKVSVIQLIMQIGGPKVNLSSQKLLC
uniref:Odorant receptor n=1 Tax=Protaetia brevitarsis TaxID=348688 RepID=A0A411HR52_PROBE|nr:odorant receptor [Protaetia brevitarsis]